MNTVKYIVQFLPLPYFLTESDEEYKKISGTINSSFFAYITPLMILVASVVVLIVLFNASTLYSYYETNIPLNSLILFLLCVSLIQAFNNNYQLYKTARFMKRIERTVHQDRVTEEDAEKLHEMLELETPLLNTKQMHGVIVKIRTFGHPNFNDNDARIIKSKLGYRIRLRRSDVGFNAGILVMLGLLGTFLGLLGTIDAVGATLGSMSDITGDIDEEMMGNFISSLSAPLQGMGLAFSSSLFGLSGSLLIGYFNHLCGGAQDTFIEDASRWIDNRIPEFDPEKKQGDKTQDVPASKDDLTTWLTGFVYMSVKTNDRLSSLITDIKRNIKNTDHINYNLEHLISGQYQMNEVLYQASSSLSGLAQKGDIIVAKLDDANRETQQLGAVVKEQFEPAQSSLSMIENILTGMNTRYSEQMKSVSTAVEELQAISRKMPDTDLIAHNASELQNGMGELRETLSVSLEGISYALEKSGQQSEVVQKHLSDIDTKIGELNAGFSASVHRIGNTLEKYGEREGTLREHLSAIEGLLETGNEATKKIIEDNAYFNASLSKNNDFTEVSFQLNALIDEMHEFQKPKEGPDS